MIIKQYNTIYLVFVCLSVHVTHPINKSMRLDDLLIIVTLLTQVVVTKI